MVETPKTAKVSLMVDMTPMLDALEQIRRDFEAVSWSYLRATRKAPRLWRPPAWYASSRRAS